MNYQSVKIFLAIVEHQSLSAAARALYITQPAVSGHLNRLEDELGCPLILRQKGVQKITLTPTGKAFVTVATQWIEAEKTVLRFKESCGRRTLHLATGITAHEYLAAPLVQKLLARDPDLDLHLHFEERTGGNLEKAMDEQRFDALFYTGRPLDSMQIISIPFFREGYCLLCPTDTPLPEGVVTPELLNPAFEIAQSFPSKERQLWHQEHFPDAPPPYASVVATLTMPIHFTDRRCWAIVPASTAMLMARQAPEKLTLRTLQPSPSRQYHIAVIKGYAHPEVIDNLLTCCREYLAERPYLQSLLPEDI